MNHIQKAALIAAIIGMACVAGWYAFITIMNSSAMVQAVAAIAGFILLAVLFFGVKK